MLRLVVLHQLIISLLAGPLLCCCTITRLGHSGHGATKSKSAGVKNQRKSCCGQQSSAPGESEAPKNGDLPSPSQCPCKDHTQAAISATSLNCLDVATFEFASLAVADSSRHPSLFSADLGCRSSSGTVIAACVWSLHGHCDGEGKSPFVGASDSPGAELWCPQHDLR